MSYKTILLQLNDPRRARSLIATAVEIARQFESHLIGLYVFPAYRLLPPIPLPIGVNVRSSITAHIREEARQVASVFEEMTVHQPFIAEWRCITDEHREPVEIVLTHARMADLVIASQTDTDRDLHGILDFPERLAIESGRPVIVVPNGATVTRAPRRIVVGWKPCREAARAVFDALPLLKIAEDVQVLAFEARGEPDLELAAALSRHGVKVNVSSGQHTEASVGGELCMQALESGAELLVLGAYGHSRVREFAFGGVTRHVLRNMTVPVLFSH